MSFFSIGEFNSVSLTFLVAPLYMIAVACSDSCCLHDNALQCNAEVWFYIHRVEQKNSNSAETFYAEDSWGY